jgi:hypothetical protein
VKNSTVIWRSTSILAAVVAYVTLAMFLMLVGTQIYRWFRDSEWPHLGVNEGIRVGLNICCAKSADGRVAEWLRWIDSPVSWLGLHRVLELVPASLALFFVSILGNSVFIYCRDKLRTS